MDLIVFRPTHQILVLIVYEICNGKCSKQYVEKSHVRVHTLISPSDIFRG